MNILTIDLEDWFHILDNYETANPNAWNEFEPRVEKTTIRLLDLLDFHKVKATFFILGWIAQNYPELVQEVANRGHEIACHSHNHQLVYTQSPGEFERDLVIATETIEQVSGIRPFAYRAPGFSVTAKTPWVFDILARNGYKIDCSIFPASRAHGGLPKFPARGPCEIILEHSASIIALPISFYDAKLFKFVFSGGGYFRILPRFMFPHLFNSSDYIMTYFHPRDFDPDQPMVPGLSMKRKFKSYIGLKSAENKLSLLLRKNSFLTVGQASLELKACLHQPPRVKIAALYEKP